MSYCECENPTNFRITGEIVQEEVRIRCGECGGKFGWVSKDFLKKFLEEKDIGNGQCLEEPIEITIDLR